MNDLQRSSTRRAVPLSPGLNNRILAHLGHQLRHHFSEPTEQKIPGELLRLLKRTSQVIRARQEPVAQEFVDEMMSVLPELRVYALALERDPDRANDLVQETVLRALAQHELFEAGTSLRAWLFTILKNHFLTMVRKRVREVEDATGSFADRLTIAPDQYDKLAHRELSAALDGLAEDQRDVLLLVAIEGLSYEDAAARLGCAVGTIKSRVNRARKHLAKRMGLTQDDVVGWTRVRA